jgi:hypothetical protein
MVLRLASIASGSAGMPLVSFIVMAERNCCVLVVWSWIILSAAAFTASDRACCRASLPAAISYISPIAAFSAKAAAEVEPAEFADARPTMPPSASDALSAAR